MSIFPSEILINHFFPNFELPDLAKACRACKQWNQAASHDGIWKLYFEKDFKGVAINKTLSIKEQYKKNYEIKVLKEIEADYPSAILKAFGGAEKVRKFSILKDVYDIRQHSCWSINHTTPPLGSFIRGRGTLSDGQSFLLVKVQAQNNPENIEFQGIAVCPSECGIKNQLVTTVTLTLYSGNEKAVGTVNVTASNFTALLKGENEEWKPCTELASLNVN